MYKYVPISAGLNNKFSLFTGIDINRYTNFKSLVLTKYDEKCENCLKTGLNFLVWKESSACLIWQR